MLRRPALVVVVLVGVGVLGVLSASALSSPAARTDPPVKAQTYPDASGDNPGTAPDITSVTAENWGDGTIGFKVSMPREAALFGNQGVGIYIDSDQDRKTGQFGD